jgi:hypothetical protein
MWIFEFFIGKTRISPRASCSETDRSYQQLLLTLHALSPLARGIVVGAQTMTSG